MSRFLFVIGLIVSIQLSTSVKASEFETERIRDTYTLLPTNVQTTIENNASGKNLRVRIDNIIQDSQIKVYYNSNNQICHLGLDLFDDAVIQDNQIEAYYFLENSLLNYVLTKQTSTVFMLAKERETSFFLNNKPVTNEIKKMIPFADIIKSKKFSLNLENYRFTANWTTLGGERFAMKFPADINLLKGMDKGQLEDKLILKMKIFASSDKKIIPQKNDFKGDQRTSNGLYIQSGTYFETDDFRSDIYLTKKNNNEYLPVYSNRFPVESFSNLFTCNLSSAIDINLTAILYGNKTGKSTLKLRKMQAFLSENNITFFGLQNDDEQSIKATIIYFNPTYRYMHMLIVEAEKTVLFGEGEKIIKADLYPFIPRANFSKEVIVE